MPALKAVVRRSAAVLIATAVLAWFVVKPVRVVAPGWLGLVCQGAVCVESAAQRATAQALVDEAKAFVGQRVGVLEGAPRVVFCATQACADAFGLGARSAVTVGTLGTVIGPRAWTPYYVRHELIHQLQGQRLGVRLWMQPEWFVEGMAYALSDDPRALLAEPWQQDRAQFRTWLARVGHDRLWDASARP